MVDKLNPIKPVASATERHQELYRQFEKEAREKLFSDKDHVSVEHEATVGTYGRLAGVEVGSPYQLLRQLVIKMLDDQGVASKVSSDDGDIDLEGLTPADANALISEEGYFGVEQTSQRIVDFAISAFGKDSTKLTQMKDAIDKGFEDAAQAFGGTLAEISQQTYAAIMEKLDVFAAGENKGQGEDHG